MQTKMLIFMVSLLLCTQFLCTQSDVQRINADDIDIKKTDAKDRIDVLRDSIAPESTERLAKLAQSLKGEERNHATTALREHISRMSLSRLRNCLIGDNQTNVRLVAIDVIKTNKRKELIPDLIDLLAHSDKSTRLAANSTLAAFAGKNIFDPTSKDSQVNKLVDSVLENITGEQTTIDPLEKPENQRIVQQQWRAWWKQNKPAEDAIASNYKLQGPQPNSSHSEEFKTDFENPTGDKSLKQQLIDKLAQKLIKMSVNGKLYRSSSDYFVVGVCDLRSRTGVADLRFMVLQGPEKVAQYVVDYMTSQTNNRTFRQWHVFDRRANREEAEKMLALIRQYYDKREEYRERMRQIYRAQNTRRC